MGFFYLLFYTITTSFLLEKGSFFKEEQPYLHSSFSSS